MTEQLVAELERTWQQLGAGNRTIGTGKPYRPIAGSSEDQVSPDGVSNPLWDVVRWMPAEPYWDGQPLEPTFVHSAFDQTTASKLDQAGATRHHLTTRFTWSIISPGDVAWMVEQLDGRAVVEIGAGTGYWAWQLEQAGVDVAAYDPNPISDDNPYCKGGPYTTVLQDDATAVKRHQDRALLMVWPPYGGGHAGHALSLYEGDLLIYAGEEGGGCTADDDFYELLDREWEQTSESTKHVTWWGIHCELSAYRRKAGA